MTTPHEIYSRLLFKEGQGYPLWNPSLPADCPKEYELAGIQVGDVGYFTPDGGFNFLFNISLDEDHAINKWRGVPNNFVRVDLGLNNVHHKRYPQFYPPKSAISYTEKGAKSIEGDVNATIPHSSVTVRGTGGHQSSYSEAAALVLRNGAFKDDYLRNLSEWAAQNVVRFYHYAITERGYVVQNGALYLVTGVTNTDSWHISTFSQKSGGNYGSFEVGVKGALSGSFSMSAASSVTGSHAPRYSPPNHKGGSGGPKVTDIETATFSALRKVERPPYSSGNIHETPMSDHNISSSTTRRGEPHGGETREETAADNGKKPEKQRRSSYEPMGPLGLGPAAGGAGRAERVGQSGGQGSGSIHETPMSDNIPSSSTRRREPPGGETREETAADNGKKPQKHRRSPSHGPRGQLEPTGGKGDSPGGAGQSGSGGQGSGSMHETPMSDHNIPSLTARKREPRGGETREETTADNGKKPQKRRRNPPHGPRGPPGPAGGKRDGPGGGPGGPGGDSGGQGSGGNRSGGNARGGGGGGGQVADKGKGNEGNFNSGGRSGSGRQHADKEPFLDDLEESEPGDTSDSAESVIPMLHPYHPSDVINRYLLEMCPESEVALTHDDIWSSIFQKSDPVILDDEELLERINASHYIHKSENKACIFVSQDTGETHLLFPKLDSMVEQFDDMPTSSSSFHSKMATKKLRFADGGALHTDVRPERHTLAKSPSRLFALIIGINKYESPDITTLFGAVPDADAVRDYLQEQLSVPSSQITYLRDTEATRAAIINEIKAFSLNDNIKEGDPIVIYYAGHGGSAEIPEGWKVGSTGKIELLIPYDSSFPLEDGHNNHNCGIPDRTLGALLSELADKKGDNITVILDCCYPSIGNIPSDLDQDIWSDFESSADAERRSVVHAGFARAGLRSHVLMAACRAEELTYERTNRGMFTVALLKALVDIGISYASLFDLRMPPLYSGQSPHCEGIHRNRLMFNGKAFDYSDVDRKIAVSEEGERDVMPDVGTAWHEDPWQ